MRIEVVETGTDVTTSFGTAGAGCICPPEEDFRIHYVEAYLVFEAGDGIQDLEGDLWTDLVDRVEEELGDVEVEAIEQVMVMEGVGCQEWMKHKEAELTDHGAIVFHLKATENEPCGHAAGVYDSIHY